MKCLLVFVGILALASTGELTCPLRGFNVTAKAVRVIYSVALQ